MTIKPLLQFLTFTFASALAAPVGQAAYVFQTLPVVPDYSFPQVNQINENSTIVGTLLGYGAVGARWASNGSLHVITSIGPAHSAWGNGINNAGLVVGMLDKDGGYLRPYYNAPGLGSVILPTTAPANTTAELKVINDSGYAAGVSGSMALYTHPLGYKATIPASKVGNAFKPVAINNAGDVLGNSSLKGVVYNIPDSSAVLVTARVPTMTTAAAMNELGDVAGVRSGNTAYIMPKPANAAVISLGAGKVKEVHGMNDARELLITTMSNRPAILRPSLAPDGEIEYLDTSVTAPWTVWKLADINNAGVVCGVVRRPSVPADNTQDAYVYLPFKLWEFVFIFPVIPLNP